MLPFGTSRNCEANERWCGALISSLAGSESFALCQMAAQQLEGRSRVQEEEPAGHQPPTHHIAVAEEHDVEVGVHVQSIDGRQGVVEPAPKSTFMSVCVCRGVCACSCVCPALHLMAVLLLHSQGNIT